MPYFPRVRLASGSAEAELGNALLRLRSTITTFKKITQNDPDLAYMYIG